MSKKKTILRLTALAMSGCMCIGLCGCRASDEITKIVYTADASEVDPDVEIRHPEIEGMISERSEEQKTEENADSKKEEQKPVEGDTPNTEQTAQTTGEGQSDTPDSDKTAPANQNGSTQNQDASSSTPGNAENPNSDQGTGSGDNPNPGADSGEKGDDDGTTPPEGDNGGNQADNPPEEDLPPRDVFDKDGNRIELPQNVGSIAAPGEAGLIVQMLGGEGVLCASSESFLSNSVAQATFADEGIGNVPALWSGDGSEPMSDGAFAQLLEMKPDCVIRISGQNNLSSAQDTALRENDIAIFTIPDMTNAYNIRSAVEAVGQVLNDHPVGNTTSVDLAREYLDYEESMLQDVASKKGWFYSAWASHDSAFSTHGESISDGDYALVLWDWDDGFSFRYIGYDGNTYVSQDGGGVLHYGWQESPMAYYMSAAGVMNTSIRDGYKSSVSWDAGASIAYFPFHFILMTGKSIPGITTQVPVGNDRIWPSGTYSAGDDTYSIISGENLVTTDSPSFELGYTKLDVYGENYDGDYAWIGDSRFPYMIVSSKEIESEINESKRSEGLYAIRPNGIEVPGLPAPYPDSYEEAGKLVVNTYSTTRQDYSILVNPCGCGNWMNGSAESILESVWISNTYYGNYNLENEIRDFYQKFYRHDPSGQMEDILDGE